MAAEWQALEGLDPQPLKCRGRDPPKVMNCDAVHSIQSKYSNITVMT